ncbi:MAG: hypothetical protein HKO65_20185 [Gemmatimonadetes bacterium]|nr:hypothetical protein [Gemmatimonadota bacterium]NNM07422.1 hypothetical protein [Gemmatimonadota bacterium]
MLVLSFLAWRSPFTDTSAMPKPDDGRLYTEQAFAVILRRAIEVDLSDGGVIRTFPAMISY